MGFRGESEKRYIQSLCYRLNEGERIDISGRLFEEAFVCGWPTIYNTPIEAFLSSMIGSAWGVWTCERNPIRDYYTIGRHPEGHERTYVDPDRAHLFRRGEDGFLHFSEA